MRSRFTSRLLLSFVHAADRSPSPDYQESLDAILCNRLLMQSLACGDLQAFVLAEGEEEGVYVKQFPLLPLQMIRAISVSWVDRLPISSWWDRQRAAALGYPALVLAKQNVSLLHVVRDRASRD